MNLEQLSKFSVGFNEDYFGEKQDINSMKEIIFSGIVNDNIYQWNYNQNICSIAQAIHGDHDFPVIGHFYSNPDFRNLGFESSLIHKLTKGLLDVGHECCMLSLML